MCAKVENNSDRWVKDKKMTQEEADALYALCEQGKVGDCNTERPGMMRFAAKRQWDAWNALKGKSREEAQQEAVRRGFRL